MIRFALVLLVLLGSAAPAVAQSRLVSERLVSKAFSGNRIGTAAERRITVYLPADYDTGAKRYPVIYYLNGFWEDETRPFAITDAKTQFDKAGFIVVTADFTTPAGTSWYVNSPVTGHWEDFLIGELVPHIDARYRTLATRESRGVAGDRVGGHGAIRFGMKYPQVFGAVYALHPIGAGSGLVPMHTRPNWDRLTTAKSVDDLGDDFMSKIFTSIFQAHLPNPDRPPLYFDPVAEEVDGELRVDSAVRRRLGDSFALESLVPAYAGNLNSLRGFKLDWGRNDANQDHVWSLQAFVRTLDEYGVSYEAEEYRGGFGDRTWGDDGRVATDLLPFFERVLIR
ncbi:esterase family protein [Asticcacaulis biprosthecium C19]|uniref:Esterase family protein n=1 Tax=Asticcacaulis biprosthecium C19 TaxID=715226 RepID=F4QLF8_9CAUL|nr:alpha/beta hydrolase-fold protein [Asticcacaulis biprosthecium]EGF92303.1 esterase family protein [Asticcacaulis biprosthecium C19]